jgi:DNA-binding MarR family transcriptional regulator
MVKEQLGTILQLQMSSRMVMSDDVGYSNISEGAAMVRHDIDRSPVHLLHRAGQCAGEIFGAVTLPGLTPRQLAVLATVADHEGLNQMEVVERTGIDRSTTADVVRRLVGKGLIQRRRSRSDARAYVLKLTDDGRADLAEAAPLANRVDAQVLNALPKARGEEFLRALLRIVATLEEMKARRPNLPIEEARSRRQRVRPERTAGSR